MGMKKMAMSFAVLETHLFGFGITQSAREEEYHGASLHHSDIYRN